MAALVKNISQEATPTGSIKPFTGTGAEPTGWLFCDGRVLDSVLNPEYASLYAVIGNTYGGVDGTDFQLPDLRGEFLRGLDNMGTPAGARGVDTGRGLGTSQADQLGQHGHPVGTLGTALDDAPHNHPQPATSSANAPHVHPNVTRLNIGGPGFQVGQAGPNVYANDNPGSSGPALAPHLHPTPATVGTQNAPHNHAITGAVGDAGGPETRVRNVAVKYMIKM